MCSSVGHRQHQYVCRCDGRGSYRSHVQRPTMSIVGSMSSPRSAEIHRLRRKCPRQCLRIVASSVRPRRRYGIQQELFFPFGHDGIFRDAEMAAHISEPAAIQGGFNLGFHLLSSREINGFDPLPRCATTPLHSLNINARIYKTASQGLFLKNAVANIKIHLDKVSLWP